MSRRQLVTASIHTYPALFTTLRHTPPSCADEAVLLVEKSHIPMLDEHIDRLREAHAHFRKRDGSNVWDEWEGDEAVWRILHTHLESICINGQGDWRVSNGGI